MTRKKLFNKYFVATTLIVLFSLTVMMLILTFAYNGYLADMKHKSLEKTCDSVAYIISSEGYDERSDREGFYYVLSNLADVSESDIFITDENGVIRMCGCSNRRADGNCDHSGTQVSKEMLSRADENRLSELGTAGIYKNPHYIMAMRVSIGGSEQGYIVAAAQAQMIRDLMLSLSKIYLLVAVIPVVLMFFALYIMTYRLTRPLKLMSDAAKAMARGDFSRRIPVTSDDEIGELAVSFNQMTNSLAQLEGMRKSFVANVSHELKTPMTTIGGFIDGIIDGTIEHEQQNHYLSIVSDEVKRLSRMVQSMLSLSRLESGEFNLNPQKFDFRELLLNVVLSQEQRIEKQRLNISGLDTVSAVTVNADRDLIHQVVYNLVDNAVKFTPEGGEIRFALKVDSKKLYFRIENTGKGIPAAELQYVFERFYKVDKSRSANKTGTGLGLYIVKTIVKTHGGTITVSSRENEFTAFEVTLPLSK